MWRSSRARRSRLSIKWRLLLSGLAWMGIGVFTAIDSRLHACTLLRYDLETASEAGLHYDHRRHVF